jgi:hypothetical protein
VAGVLWGSFHPQNISPFPFSRGRHPQTAALALPHRVLQHHRPFLQFQLSLDGTILSSCPSPPRRADSHELRGVWPQCPSSICHVVRVEWTGMPHLVLVGTGHSDSPTYVRVQRHFGKERDLQVLAHDLCTPGRGREYLRFFLRGE